MKNINFVDAVENAAALIAMGQSPVYLSCGEIPWEYATSVEPGCTHRLDMCTSVWFTAEHPCGLCFRWSFDIESRSANGKGSYEIDVASCRATLLALPDQVRASFRDYLLQCAEKVEAKGAEYQSVADRQALDGRTLRDIALAKTDNTPVVTG